MHVNPGTGELFYLRMLLMTVWGALSFEDLKTYQGIVHDTFRQACQLHGLIGDDTQWFSLFDEAIVWATSSQLRNLFMVVVQYNDIGNIRLLFDKYWRTMTDDIAYNMRRSLDVHSCAIPDHTLQVHLLKELFSFL